MERCFLLVLATALFAGAAPQPKDTPAPERSLMIGVLRVLNIAQVSFAHDSGRFGTFDDLRPVLARMQAAATKGDTGAPRYAGDRNGLSALVLQGDDPLPGWTLRVIPAPDGKHYSLAVKNKQYCDVNGFSDETGVIYSATAYGCDHKLPPAAPAK